MQLNPEDRSDGPRKIRKISAASDTPGEPCNHYGNEFNKLANTLRHFETKLGEKKSFQQWTNDLQTHMSGIKEYGPNQEFIEVK